MNHCCASSYTFCMCFRWFSADRDWLHVSHSKLLRDDVIQSVRMSQMHKNMMGMREEMCDSESTGDLYSFHGHGNSSFISGYRLVCWSINGRYCRCWTQRCLTQIHQLRPCNNDGIRISSEKQNRKVCSSFKLFNCACKSTHLLGASVVGQPIRAFFI